MALTAAVLRQLMIKHFLIFWVRSGSLTWKWKNPPFIVGLRIETVLFRFQVTLPEGAPLVSCCEVVTCRGS